MDAAAHDVLFMDARAKSGSAPVWPAYGYSSLRSSSATNRKSDGVNVTTTGVFPDCASTRVFFFFFPGFLVGDFQKVCLS